MYFITLFLCYVSVFFPHRNSSVRTDQWCSSTGVRVLSSQFQILSSKLLLPLSHTVGAERTALHVPVRGILVPSADIRNLLIMSHAMSLSLEMAQRRVLAGNLLVGWPSETGLTS